MKILLLAGSYPPEPGGIARYMHSFVKSLRAKDVDVQVVSQIDLSGSYLRRIRTCRGLVMTHATREKFDRVVVSSWSPYAVRLPESVNGQPLPFDTFCHGMDLLEPARSMRYRMLLKRTLGRASRVLVNSRFTGDLAIRLGKAPSNRITVVHPTVDAEHFLPAADKTPGRILLSVGRLVERKGFDQVIRALPEIVRRFPDVSYRCVGEGEDRQRLQDLAGALGVASHVELVGAVSESELIRHYQSSDIFIMPARAIKDTGSVEGFGIVYLEAAACGLPAIGGRSGGVSDALEDGVTGYLVAPDSPEEILNRTVGLLDNIEVRHKMGQAARERARRLFHEGRIAEIYLDAVLH